MEEKISIIMASYNYAHFIGEAIESVINQTYKNWELIIIDDASTDNSLEVIEEYVQKDSRIKLLINEKNLGLAGTLQKGIESATGNWIAFLESDDVFFQNSLEEKVKAINSGAGIIYTDLELFGDEKSFCKYWNYMKDMNKYLALPDNSIFINNFKEIVAKVNPIPTFSVVMVKKELLKKCNFNSICKASLDHYLWAQLAVETKVYYIHQKLTKWRLHGDSYINRSKNSWLKEYLFYINLYIQTIKDKPVLIRIFLILNYMRVKIFYVKLNKNVFKINFFNSKLIFEKKFTKDD